MFISGGDNVRPYWDRYYTGGDGVIFVVDSSADDKTMEVAKSEFDKALSHHELDGLPLLFLANYQDVPGAKSEAQVKYKVLAEIK
jgi:GTPase SAR1 family protein